MRIGLQFVVFYSTRLRRKEYLDSLWVVDIVTEYGERSKIDEKCSFYEDFQSLKFSTFQENRVEFSSVSELFGCSWRQTDRRVMIFAVRGRPLNFFSFRTFQGYDKVR